MVKHQQLLFGNGWVPGVRTSSLWQRFWAPFWMVPIAISVASVGLALLLSAIDGLVANEIPLFFHSGASGARSLLSTIASITISITGPVFSITLVVLQLASSQFTPRILGSFLESRVTQFSLGMFVGTFLYALTVMRSIRTDPDFVPQLATSFAFFMVVGSMGMFLAFIRHIVLSIQISEVIFRIQLSGIESLDNVMPEDQAEVDNITRKPWRPDEEESVRDVYYGGRGGYICEINYNKLMSFAHKHGGVIEVLYPVGHYVPCNQVIARWFGPKELDGVDDLSAAVTELMSFNRERTIRQDFSFSIRQLVDIAERALSPGVNDPTTAIQCINCIQSLCRVMVTRRVPSNYLNDDDGELRVIYQPQTVEENLELAVVEIAHWGSTSVRIGPALHTMINDLRSVALPEYQQVLDRLDNVIDEKMDNPVE